MDSFQATPYFDDKKAGLADKPKPKQLYVTMPPKRDARTRLIGDGDMRKEQHIARQQFLVADKQYHNMYVCGARTLDEKIRIYTDKGLDIKNKISLKGVTVWERDENGVLGIIEHETPNGKRRRFELEHKFNSCRDGNGLIVIKIEPESDSESESEEADGKDEHEGKEGELEPTKNEDNKEESSLPPTHAELMEQIDVQKIEQEVQQTAERVVDELKTLSDGMGEVLDDIVGACTDGSPEGIRTAAADINSELVQQIEQFASIVEIPLPSHWGSSEVEALTGVMTTDTYIHEFVKMSVTTRIKEIMAMKGARTCVTVNNAGGLIETVVAAPGERHEASLVRADDIGVAISTSSSIITRKGENNSAEITHMFKLNITVPPRAPLAGDEQRIPFKIYVASLLNVMWFKFSFYEKITDAGDLQRQATIKNMIEAMTCLAECYTFAVRADPDSKPAMLQDKPDSESTILATTRVKEDEWAVCYKKLAKAIKLSKIGPSEIVEAVYSIGHLGLDEAENASQRMITAVAKGKKEGTIVCASIDELSWCDSNGKVLFRTRGDDKSVAHMKASSPAIKASLGIDNAHYVVGRFIPGPERKEEPALLTYSLVPKENQYTIAHLLTCAACQQSALTRYFRPDDACLKHLVVDSEKWEKGRHWCEHQRKHILGSRLDVNNAAVCNPTGICCKSPRTCGMCKYSSQCWCCNINHIPIHLHQAFDRGQIALDITPMDLGETRTVSYMERLYGVRYDDGNPDPSFVPVTVTTMLSALELCVEPMSPNAKLFAQLKRRVMTALQGNDKAVPTKL